MPRSVGWHGAAVRDSSDGPGEAAVGHAGLRTSTPGLRLRPSHHNGPVHRTGIK